MQNLIALIQTTKEKNKVLLKIKSEEILSLLKCGWVTGGWAIMAIKESRNLKNIKLIWRTAG